MPIARRHNREVPSVLPSIFKDSLKVVLLIAIAISVELLAIIDSK